MQLSRVCNRAHLAESSKGKLTQFTTQTYRSPSQMIAVSYPSPRPTQRWLQDDPHRPWQFPGLSSEALAEIRARAEFGDFEPSKLGWGLDSSLEYDVQISRETGPGGNKKITYNRFLSTAQEGRCASMCGPQSHPSHVGMHTWKGSGAIALIAKQARTSMGRRLRTGSCSLIISHFYLLKSLKDST